MSYEIPTIRLQIVRDRNETVEERHQIRSPGDALNVLQSVIGDYDTEALCVVMLDTKNRVLGASIVAHGGLNAAYVRVADVFKPAIIANACSIIIGHNHPSGDPTPSPEDVRVTENIVNAGELLDISVLDHIIVCYNDRYTSLKERRLGFK